MEIGRAIERREGEVEGEQEEEEASLESVPDSILQLLLFKCGDPQSIARGGCVNRRWHGVAFNDEIWKDLCLHSFALSNASDPFASPCSSFKEAYGKWHASYGHYSRVLTVRAKRCWDTILNWARDEFPDVASSCLPGASEEELDAVEKELGWRLPESVRLLYRFYNGQKVPVNNHTENNYIGLLGGYQFYRHFVNVQFLSIQQACAYTRRLLPFWCFPASSKLLMIAVSCKGNKFFFLNGNDGMVYVGTKKLETQRELMPCVPKVVEGETGRGGNSCDVPDDSMLRWLEEYGRRLVTGMYRVRRHHESSSISLFPEKEPLCSEAVTSGVQVRCSAVFVPELSTMLKEGEDEETFCFCYSVQMCLLPCGEGPSSHHLFDTCQLSKRHWYIRSKEDDPVLLREVHGEAVIGEYPLLRVGDRPFVYASCSPLRVPSGCMEGGFTFLPGSLSRGEGAEFYATAASFPLQIPNFIF